MNASTFRSLILAAAMFAIAGGLNAQVNVTANITTSQTWTAGTTYNLVNQIYVMPGATLTIEAGTIIASTPTANGSGSLAVSRGARIFVQGTRENPVIMTSTNDTATWTGGDPKTGVWREAANEWGNLTIMGRGYIAEDATVGNTATPNAANVAQMEGLTAAFPGDPSVLYGGGNDDDDSGSISYLSIRYGGRVVGLNNELNGLSLGGIGRETDIHHVEIMNNVDDGVEIWGGTVNLNYISVWNIGDDSFDIDQGYRGAVQYVLIVQGYSLDASQGSGVGDNCFETDGAEDSDWQPVTTTTIYNATVIGQPVDGDGATTWRDNARVQYRNCIFMDCGEKVVRFDNVDGDGANGYGHNGTLSWAASWTTPYTATSTVNAAANPGELYTVQTSGNLCEIKDSVLYANFNSAAYTEFNTVGANAASCNNVIEPASSPIVSITRGTPVTKGGKIMLPVTALDPRPAADALTSVNSAPIGGLHESRNFRGAFAPGFNWLAGWTASGAFGITPSDYYAGVTGGQPWTADASFDVNGARNMSGAAVGGTGVAAGPHYADVALGENIDINVTSSFAMAPVLLLGGSSLTPGALLVDPLIGGAPAGTIDLTPFNILADGTQVGWFNQFMNTGPTGSLSLSLPNFLPAGTVLNWQVAILNPVTVVKMSNAVQVRVK